MWNTVSTHPLRKGGGAGGITVEHTHPRGGRRGWRDHCGTQTLGEGGGVGGITVEHTPRGGRRGWRDRCGTHP